MFSNRLQESTSNRGTTTKSQFMKSIKKTIVLMLKLLRKIIKNYYQKIK